MRKIKRDQMVPFFTNLEPCLVGMETCGSVPYWAQKLEQPGHRAKLMALQFVKPNADEQERCSGCGSDLWRGEPAKYVLCFDQER